MVEAIPHFADAYDINTGMGRAVATVCLGPACLGWFVSYIRWSWGSHRRMTSSQTRVRLELPSTAPPNQSRRLPFKLALTWVRRRLFLSLQVLPLLSRVLVVAIVAMVAWLV